MVKWKPILIEILIFMSNSNDILARNHQTNLYFWWTFGENLFESSENGFPLSSDDNNEEERL